MAVEVAAGVVVAVVVALGGEEADASAVAAEDAGKMGPGWGVVASESGGNWAVQEMEVRYVASLREPAAPKT